ncbi:hypothetical protein Tco_1141245 [Tanacetum coccineum]
MDDNSSAEPLVFGNNKGGWCDDDKDDPDYEPTLDSAACTNSTEKSDVNTFSKRMGEYIPSGVLADTIREVGPTSSHVHKVKDKIQSILSDPIDTSTPDVLVSVSRDTSNDTRPIPSHSSSKNSDSVAFSDSFSNIRRCNMRILSNPCNVSRSVSNEADNTINVGNKIGFNMDGKKNEVASILANGEHTVDQ